MYSLEKIVSFLSKILFFISPVSGSTYCYFVKLLFPCKTGSLSHGISKTLHHIETPQGGLQFPLKQ